MNETNEHLTRPVISFRQFSNSSHKHQYHGSFKVEPERHFNSGSLL